MRSPRVSVVIPAFDVKSWVGAAISSAVEQVPPPYEVIVVDDGSSDGTGKLAAATGGVRVIRQANRGLSGARNSGAESATGDALLFLDADDQLEIGALAALLDNAAANPGWAAIVPNYVKVGLSSGLGWSKAEATVMDRRHVPRMLRSNRLAANALVRRDVWDSHRFREDLRASEDLDFWLRLLLDDERLVILAEPLVRVHVGRAGSLSSRLRPMRESRRRVFASLWSRSDLRSTERALIVYQLARTSIGVLAAPGIPTRARPNSPPSVLHVYLDEPGGGPTHVNLLHRSLGDRVVWRELALDPVRLHAASLLWPRTIVRLWRTIGRDRPIVHAHGVRAATAGVLAARLRGTRSVVTIHGLHSLRRSRSPLVRTLNRFVLRRADTILVLSASDRRGLVDSGIVAPARIRSIRAGFDWPVLVEREAARRALAAPTQNAVILWLGRMVQEKDPLCFVRAFCAVGETPVAIMAGTGELLSDVEGAINESCSDRIHLPGWIEAGLALGAADIYVNTSRWEGLSLAALEAASAGLPLVLTDVPGNRDLVEAGVPAVLVPQSDPAALAAVLTELVADPHRRREMGAEAARVVRSTFTAEALAEDVLRVYAELEGGPI
jgi:glycosyltransferase involved in cell wall biosynthesis